MSDNKGYQIERNANSPEALSLTENPTQKHDYKGSSHSQPATLPGQGEAPKRQTKANKAVTSGHHVSAANVRTWDEKDPVAEQRTASVLHQRAETEALFAKHRKKSSSNR